MRERKKKRRDEEELKENIFPVFVQSEWETRHCEGTKNEEKKKRKEQKRHLDEEKLRFREMITTSQEREGKRGEGESLEEERFPLHQQTAFLLPAISLFSPLILVVYLSRCVWRVERKGEKLQTEEAEWAKTIII